ncbi:MAG: hypothetical protein ACYDDF_15325 [Thermoplasmatota archaeon]
MAYDNGSVTPTSPGLDLINGSANLAWVTLNGSQCSLRFMGRGGVVSTVASYAAEQGTANPAGTDFTALTHLPNGAAVLAWTGGQAYHVSVQTH